MSSMDAVYDAIWASYGEQFACPIPNETLRSWPFLYDLAVGAGMDEASSVVDIGCGRGEHTRQLAHRTKCPIWAIDCVLSRVIDAAERDASTVNCFIQSTVQDLPFRTCSVDFIWCCDMLMHVQDLAKALAECLRVLRPGGKMLIVTVLETEWMEPKERVRLYGPLSMHPQNLCKPLLEQHIMQAGFTTVKAGSMGAEIIESQHRGGYGSYDLIKLARLRRIRASLDAVGERTYETVYAFHEWIVYQLLGKLAATYYLLQKPAPHENELERSQHRKK